MDLKVGLTTEERTLLKLTFDIKTDEELVERIYKEGLKRIKEYLLLEIYQKIEKEDSVTQQMNEILGELKIGLKMNEIKNKENEVEEIKEDLFEGEYNE